MRNYKGSIQKRLVYIIMLVTITTGVIGFSGFLYWFSDLQQKRAMTVSQTVVHVLGQDVAKLLLLKDISSASDITTKLKSFSDIQKLVLFSLDKKPIYQYSSDNKSFDVGDFEVENRSIQKLSSDKIKVNLPVNYENRHLGFVELEIKIKSIYNFLQQAVYILFFILLAMFLFSYILSIFFANQFTDPILKLVKYLEKIDKIDVVKNKIKTQEDNEYGLLYDEINIMLHRIKTSQKELKLAAVAFNTQNGMIITNKDQKIIRANKAFTKITGYTQEEVLGKKPAILKSGLHNKEFYESIYLSLDKNNFWLGEVQNKHKSGSIVNEQLTIQAVLDDDEKEVLYYVASFIDITKQKMVEKQLKQKETLLMQQSKMAQMGEMLENIAHQWRQPLSVISTSATGVLMQKEFEILTDEILEESLQNITRSVQHLSQTVDDFRSFYKDHKHPVKFRLDKALEKSISLVLSSIRKNNIEFIKDFQEIEIVGLENELIQVFLNIINNAKDELEKQQQNTRYIFITMKTSQDKVSIEFKDSAGGISENILPKIFDNHFTTKSQNGTGIGLYMSKLIVEKSCGSIEVSNETYTYDAKNLQGASFVVILPKELSL